MKRISSSGNMILFTATALVVIVGMVWGLLVFSVPTINDEATSKATELAGAMQDAGLAHRRWTSSPACSAPMVA